MKSNVEENEILLKESVERELELEENIKELEIQNLDLQEKAEKA